ncbi:MAG TPA: hypothetical protein DCE42_22755 [Myxococcales bacterium]|nr:hypothetical protein [Myxococcales bacterium]
MCSFAPAQVALVHGEGGAREALRDALHQAQVKTVHLPTIGSSIEVTNIKTTFYPKKKASKGERKEPFAHKNLPELGEMIRAQKTPGRLYTVQELLVLWGDAEGAQNDNELLRVATVLDSKNSPFKKDKKRPFLYTLRKHFRSAKKGDAEEEKSGPLDPASAMQRVDAYLSKKDGLYKRSGHNQRQTLVLSFNFPKRAKELHKAVIDQLKVETGWEIELRETPNQQALMELVHRLLPSDAKLEKTPSLHLQEEKIVVQLATALPIPSLQAIADQYLEKTGFQLAFKGISLTPPPQEPPASEETEAPDAPKVEQTTQKEAPSTDDASVSSTSSLSIPDLPDASSPQELNQAYQLIRNVFAGAEHELLKVGQKGQALEVTFISPYVGERYADVLAKLSKIVGWEIKIRPRSDQHKIKEIAKQLIPEEWGLRKEPGFHQDQATIKAKISVEPPAGEAQALNAILQQKTGFSLEFDVKK